MKKLQNNFTTPEQSKRLLELGVPVDSADCHYLSELDPYVYVLTMPFSILIGHAGNNKCIPCWSVGRLIEIIGTCAIFPPHGSVIFIHDESDYIGHMMRTLEKHTEWFDFSKLEE